MQISSLEFGARPPLTPVALMRYMVNWWATLLAVSCRNAYKNFPKTRRRRCLSQRSMDWYAARHLSRCVTT